MTPRAFPNCECAAGYKIDPEGDFIKVSGVRVLPTIGLASEEFVPYEENFYDVVLFKRKEYRIPKGAWEIAFEVDE